MRVQIDGKFFARAGERFAYRAVALAEPIAPDRLTGLLRRAELAGFTVVSLPQSQAVEVDRLGPGNLSFLLRVDSADWPTVSGNSWRDRRGGCVNPTWPQGDGLIWPHLMGRRG